MDTANKRMSAMNVASPWRGLLPIPDGAIAQGDRQHVALMYAGILAEAAQADPTVDTDQYARVAFSETVYNRMGADETTYNRTGASDTTYARP